MEPEMISDTSDMKDSDKTLNSDLKIKESDTTNNTCNGDKTESNLNCNLKSQDDMKENVGELQANTDAQVNVSLLKSKDEIVESIESLTDKPVEEIKETINQLKIAFYSIRKKEIEKEKSEFLEKGNEEAAFAAAVDPLEERMKDALKNYKERRAEYLAKIESEKQENLKLKNEILSQLQDIVNDTDNINRHYSKFQQLQQDFRNVGDVPPENITQLWKSYQVVTENFYDLLKINKDLRDYDFKKNLELKESLIKAAEELDGYADVVSAFNNLQGLHKQWREIGPVSQELREDIWTKFKGYSTSINKKYQSFFEVRKEEEKKNEDAKTAICEKIEAIDLSELKSYNQWNQSTDVIKTFQEEWKNLGFASKKVNATLFARFRKSCDEFFAKKAEYFKLMKDESNQNLAKKIELCEKAEALKDSTDWKATTNDLIALQKEWKLVGAVSKKHSDAVWKRFLSACDYFFEQKDKQYSDVHKIERENLEQKKELISSFKSLLEEVNAENAVARVREYMNKWKEIGHVPFKEKDKIYTEYQEIVKKAFEKFDMREVKAAMNNFENSLNNISNDTDKLYRERDKVVRIYEMKRNELKVFENNMTFFTAKSKAGSSMLKEMERRIEKIKNEISDLKKKIEIIDSKF